MLVNASHFWRIDKEGRIRMHRDGISKRESSSGKEFFEPLQIDPIGCPGYHQHLWTNCFDSLVGGTEQLGITRRLARTRSVGEDVVVLVVDFDCLQLWTVMTDEGLGVTGEDREAHLVVGRQTLIVQRTIIVQDQQWFDGVLL